MSGELTSMGQQEIGRLNVVDLNKVEVKLVSMAGGKAHLSVKVWIDNPYFDKEAYENAGPDDAPEEPIELVIDQIAVLSRGDTLNIA